MRCLPLSSFSPSPPPAARVPVGFGFPGASCHAWKQSTQSLRSVSDPLQPAEADLLVFTSVVFNTGQIYDPVETASTGAVRGVSIDRCRDAPRGRSGRPVCGELHLLDASTADPPHQPHRRRSQPTNGTSPPQAPRSKQRRGATG